MANKMSSERSRKGIILAGGAGTRLFPLSLLTSKQLLPVYDKPMIYYPLSTVMLAGITDILIIVGLLGDGGQLGLSIGYAVQHAPKGIAEALLIAEEFLDGDPSCLILGDNLFYGDGLVGLLESAGARASGASVFGYRVSDPERYGVVGFDETGKTVSLEEKPSVPKSGRLRGGNWRLPT